MQLRSEIKRGRCPGLDTPMRTGDGLLARTGSEALPLEAWRGLCDAVAQHGNGGIEITSRGCVQLRGLSERSWQPFCDRARECGFRGPIAPVLHQNLDLAALAAPDLGWNDLLARLTALLENLRGRRLFPPKFSVAIDAGVGPHFDALATDVRLRLGAPDSTPRLHLLLRGDHSEPESVRLHALDAWGERISRLLLARADGDLDERTEPSGRRAEATDARSERAPLGPWHFPHPHGPDAGTRGPAAQTPSRHAARERALEACGIGIPVGSLGAETLRTLLDAAARDGAQLLKPHPRNALWFARAAPDAARRSDPETRAGPSSRAPSATPPSHAVASQPVPAWPHLLARAAELSLATSDDDPSLQLSACVGAPACSSAELDTRSLCRSWLAAGAASGLRCVPVHISGCAKRCGRPQTTKLEITGTSAGCELQMDGERVQRALSPAAAERELLRILHALDLEADAHA